MNDHLLSDHMVIDYQTCTIIGYPRFFDLDEIHYEVEVFDLKDYLVLDNRKTTYEIEVVRDNEVVLGISLKIKRT